MSLKTEGLDMLAGVREMRSTNDDQEMKASYHPFCIVSYHRTCRVEV